MIFWMLLFYSRPWVCQQPHPAMLKLQQEIKNKELIASLTLPSCPQCHHQPCPCTPAGLMCIPALVCDILLQQFWICMHKCLLNLYCKKSLRIKWCLSSLNGFNSAKCLFRSRIFQRLCCRHVLTLLWSELQQQLRWPEWKHLGGQECPPHVHQEGVKVLI